MAEFDFDLWMIFMQYALPIAAGVTGLALLFWSRTGR